MPRPRGRTPVRGRRRASASPSTVGVASTRPRGASGADGHRERPAGRLQPDRPVAERSRPAGEGEGVGGGVGHRRRGVAAASALNYQAERRAVRRSPPRRRLRDRRPENAPDDVVPDPIRSPRCSRCSTSRGRMRAPRRTSSRASSQSMPLGRVYGGQVLAQSIVAAQRTTRRGPQRPLDARLLPAPGRLREGHHLLGRPHPRRPLVLDAAHAGVPGGRADLLDDRVVPGRGPGHRAPGADARRVSPRPTSCRTSSRISKGLHPMSKRLFTDRPVDLRHIPSPIYLSRRGRARAAARRCG